jgi:peptide/nickel transport system substrate-binding protein
MNQLSRAGRLRLRRSFKQHKRRVNTRAQRAGNLFELDFIERIDSLVESKRFAFTWIALAVLMFGLTVLQTLNLSGVFQHASPARGGVYSEGMVGTYSGANPLFATGAVDSAVSKLLFAGLFTYNQDNQLVGDLASSYDLDDTEKTYTVHLKPNLSWHDGKPLTADDVVYTFQLIQNPDVKSPLFSGWQGITISAPDDSTVKFVLNGSLASFPHSLTTGIIPKHIVSKIEPGRLRTSSFNTTQPVGAGPFKWDTLQLSSASATGSSTGIISLVAFDHYHRGRPMLDGFSLHTYENVDQLLRAYDDRTINAAAGLKALPDSIEDGSSSHVHHYRTTAAVMVFLKNSGLLADAKLRSALNYGTDKQAIIAKLPSQQIPVRSPILRGQTGFDPVYQQERLNTEKAKQLLTEAGWVVGKDGVRGKDNQKLLFRLYGEDTPDNKIILNELKKQWKLLGVEMLPVLQQPTDFQVSVQLHTYDALLYGISIGVDPDVYAYWHSSQADARATSRLNFAEYTSKVADASLEAGRTRSNVELRALKYQPFLKAWHDDTPAITLYEPEILYVTRGEVAGRTVHTLNTDTDRYNNISEWSIVRRQVTN